MNRRHKRPSKAEQRAALAWTDAKVGKPCAVCGEVGVLWGDGLLDGHHVLPLSFLRRTLTAKDLQPDPAILYDVRNQLVLCRADHEAHTNGSRRLPLSLVPPAALEFARELDGLVAGSPFSERLRRDYVADEEAAA